MLIRTCIWGLVLFCGGAFAAPLQVESRTMIWDESKNPDVPITPLSSNWTKGGIRLPYITSSNPDVAARINDTLFLTLLETPAPTKPGKRFQLPHGLSPLAIGAISFTVFRNDEMVLSLKTKSEVCGSYCDDYFEFYNFDAQTGRLIGARDILTPDGMTAVAAYVDLEMKRRYSREINALKKEIKALGKSDQPDKKSEEISLQEALSFNEECRGSVSEKVGNLSPSNLNADIYPANFYNLLITKNGLLLEFGRCGNHARRGLNMVDNIEVKIPKNELSLTAYGKRLLFAQGDAPMPNSPYGQLLHGMIGNAPIVMRLTSPYGNETLEGVYYYTKFRKIITLAGKRDGTSLELSESHEGADDAKFLLRRSNTGFVGHWKSSRKQLPVTLDW